MLNDGARDSKIWASQADSLKAPRHIGMDNSSRGSTSKLTSYTPWRITRRRLECMAPPTRIQHNLYVSSLCMLYAAYFSTMQGELEHHTSKIRFARTSHKAYISQLASIEQQQVRIHCIRMKRDALNLADPIPNKVEEHHIIGQSQNFPENLTGFMQVNMGDPAVEVSLHSSYDLVAGLIVMTYYYEHFILKLRAHILPRIAAVHQEMNPQATLDSAVHVSNETVLQSPPSQLNHVLFKGDWIYRHRLLCVNYTTYDLQQEFDSINPCTDHRDIMLLSSSDGDCHPFCYAQVLGIFHANIIYTGPGTKDFQSRWIEFLWV